MRRRVGTPVLLPCRGSLAARRTVLPPECSFPLFSRERRLHSGVLHPFRPFHDLWPVPHLDDGFGRDQIQVVHLVAVRAQDDEILRVVVLPVPVNMGNLKHRWYAEAAMGAQGIVCGKGDFPVVDPLSHHSPLSQR